MCICMRMRERENDIVCSTVTTLVRELPYENVTSSVGLCSVPRAEHWLFMQIVEVFSKCGIIKEVCTSASYYMTTCSKNLKDSVPKTTLYSNVITSFI